MASENCGGKLFHTGHTCGDCQRLYVARHANRRSWGVDPRVTAPAGAPPSPESAAPDDGAPEQRG